MVPVLQLIPRKAMQSFVRTSSIRRKVSIAALSGLSLFTLASCEGDDEIPGRIVIASSPTMTVTPKASTLTVGGTQQLTGQVKDGGGSVINTPITWTSSDPEVVTVSATGLVNAVAPGNGSIVASASNGARSSASFTVLGSTTSAVQITGPTGLLAVGTSRQLSATAFDANNNPMPANITWTSSNPTAVKVNDAGVLIGQGPGTATITASAGGSSSTFNVTSALLTLSMAITPSTTTLAAPSTTQLSAIPRDGFGNPINLPVTWSLTTNNGTTLSNTGLLTIPAGAIGSSVVAASVTDAGGTTTLSTIVNPLRSGTANNRTGIAGIGGQGDPATTSFYRYYVNVPAGTTALNVVLSGGTGDPDLYVDNPSGTQRCASEGGAGATETCNITTTLTPGIWRVRVEGWTNFTGWTLATTITPTPP
jgi:hypothetical protein